MKINLTPILLAYDRLWQKRDTGCICPSHASNRGECPVHDDKGRVRGRAASNQERDRDDSNRGVDSPASERA